MLLGLDPCSAPICCTPWPRWAAGDRIALVDANYPATRGRRLIHLPGIAAPRPAGRAVGAADRHVHRRAVRGHASGG